MRRSPEAAVCVLLAAALASAPGCTRPLPPAFEIGHHRVRLTPPAHFEHIDHGKTHLFRTDETELSLTDLGPASPQGMAQELREARSTWLAGRRDDAFARVRELRGPSFHFASSEERADFWRPWHDITSLHDGADRLAIAAAFDSLIARAERFALVSRVSLARYALEVSSDMRRREISSVTTKERAGGVWTEVGTWDHVTHGSVRRLAALDNGGYLLALSLDRGAIEKAGPVFEALLASIEIAPAPETSAAAAAR